MKEISTEKKIAKNLQKELQHLLKVISGYRALDQLNDHYINYFNTGMHQFSEAKLNQLIDGKPDIKLRIRIYETRFNRVKNVLEEMGEDPFPMNTAETIKMEDEIMEQFPFLTRTRRAKRYVWFWNLLNRYKSKKEVH